jgi:predicted metal-dependent phosphoesterase TrpH
MEASIQGRHVLIYNTDPGRISSHDIKRLKEIKRPDNLIVAPHPFFPSTYALRGLLKPNIELFDAIESCHFYTERINFNIPAHRLALKHNIPIMGTSDAHQRYQFHTTYSLIDADPDPVSIIQAIKAGRVQVRTRPLSFREALVIKNKMLWRNAIYRAFPNLNGKRECGFAETTIKK